MKHELATARRDAWPYVIFWADCLDYAYGFDDIGKTSSFTSLGMSLLLNADRELRAAISQLLEHRPNPKSAMSSRMALEMYLKVFLVQMGGFSEARIKALSHRLDKLLGECAVISADHSVLNIKDNLAIFPDIDERYTGTEMPAPRLWDAYAVAQYSAASIVRSFTDRDTRPQLQKHPGAP